MALYNDYSVQHKETYAKNTAHMYKCFWPAMVMVAKLYLTGNSFMHCVALIFYISSL